MIKAIFFHTLTIVLISALQLSLISGLPSILSNFNLILVTLISALIVKKFDLAIYYAIGFGFLLNTFLFAPLSFYIIILVLIVIINNSLLNNFFADRSIYSFLTIGAITTINYAIFIKINQYLITIFTKNELMIVFDYKFFINLLSSLFLNSILIILAFSVIEMFYKGLKPIFLKR